MDGSASRATTRSSATSAASSATGGSLFAATLVASGTRKADQGTGGCASATGGASHADSGSKRQAHSSGAAGDEQSRGLCRGRDASVRLSKAAAPRAAATRRASEGSPSESVAQRSSGTTRSRAAEQSGGDCRACIRAAAEANAAAQPRCAGRLLDPPGCSGLAQSPRGPWHELKEPFAITSMPSGGLRRPASASGVAVAVAAAAAASHESGSWPPFGCVARPRQPALRTKAHGRTHSPLQLQPAQRASGPFRRAEQLPGSQRRPGRVPQGKQGRLRRRLQQPPAHEADCFVPRPEAAGGLREQRAWPAGPGAAEGRPSGGRGRPGLRPRVLRVPRRGR
mmetsp:Transcript_23253/g.88094  ORF Transcript_23253/g.88094 Transcript_23253/m.88094 type:complete len:339 (-) Transcript_23253:1185-2201(-)